MPRVPLIAETQNWRHLSQRLVLWDEQHGVSTTIRDRVKYVLRSPRLLMLGAAVVCEVVLLLIALVPQSIWASHGLPDGPIPRSLSSVVAGVFYLLPAATGMLCERWQHAIVFATFPAWLDLGIFAVAAAVRVGPFYLATEPHAVSTVGTLELFAVLGLLGWLARPVLSRMVRRETAGTP